MAATTAALLVGSNQAAATNNLNCGDPGTFHNMPVDPANDPDGLDGNDDGVGCEDPSVFGPDGQPAPASEPETPEPEPVAPDAPPAAPVDEQPTYTG